MLCYAGLYIMLLKKTQDLCVRTRHYKKIKKTKINPKKYNKEKIIVKFAILINQKEFTIALNVDAVF